MDIAFAVIFIFPVLAVWASFGFVWVVQPKFDKNIRLLLAFSGAFLLALTFFELLPGVYDGENAKTMALFILAGILLQIFLEFFSKGAEHGHMHIDGEKNDFPVLLFLSLSIHALVEGVPIEGNTPILYGIIVHKVPIAIILSIFLLNSKMQRGYILLFISIFSLMTPLGTYLATYSSWVSEYGNYLNALAIGVFLHVSTIILFESSQGHSFNFRKLIVILIGVGAAYLI